MTAYAKYLSYSRRYPWGSRSSFYPQSTALGWIGMSSLRSRAYGMLWWHRQLSLCRQPFYKRHFHLCRSRLGPSRQLVRSHKGTLRFVFPLILLPFTRINMLLRRSQTLLNLEQCHHKQQRVCPTYRLLNRAFRWVWFWPCLRFFFSQHYRRIRSSQASVPPFYP